MSPTAVELVGGPLDGVFHELQFGWPLPAKMGLPNEDKTILHWYTLGNDDRMYFIESVTPAKGPTA